MTPHNNANLGDIAKTVLLPGDPLRAKHIADTFLEDCKQITDVRNMYGYTGVIKDSKELHSVAGKTVTVMGSGMGGPSCGIYSYELFYFYGVEQIIRIGTAGGLQPELELGDLIFAMTASTDSNYARQYQLPGTFSPCADYTLLDKAVKSAVNLKYPYKAGSVFSSDFFSSYNALNELTGDPSWKPWARMGCLVQEMETYALYCNAAWLHKKALSIVTNVASCITDEELKEDKKYLGIEPMVKVALSLV